MVLDGNPTQAGSVERPAESGQRPECVGDPVPPDLDPQPADKAGPQGQAQRLTGSSYLTEMQRS